MGSFEKFQELCFEYNLNYIFSETKEEIFKNNFGEQFTEKEIKDYIKRLNNIYSKRYRIRKKLLKWKEIYFITLTLDNENINKANRTIYDKIKKIFKEKNYIAVEDYGKTTNRKHYHVMVDEKTELKNWTYGFYLQLKVNNKVSDRERLTKYITKLTNHNIKKGVKKIIYGHRTKTRYTR